MNLGKYYDFYGYGAANVKNRIKNGQTELADLCLKNFGDFLEANPNVVPTKEEGYICCQRHLLLSGQWQCYRHCVGLTHDIESDSKPCSLKSESSEHLYIKQWAFTECQSLGLPVEIEKRIPTDNGFQIADICVPDKHKILEVQVSTQTEIAPKLFLGVIRQARL